MDIAYIMVQVTENINRNCRQEKCHFTCKKEEEKKNWARGNLVQENEKAYLNQVLGDISDSDLSNDRDLSISG